MSTAPAPSPAATIPALGDAVVISFFDAAHNVHVTIAHVLSLSPSGIAEPSLTVAYPNLPASARNLGSARWWEGYARTAGVKHVSHPDVVAGRESISWDGLPLQPPAGYVELPKPSGDAANPVFAREEVKDTGIGQSPEQTLAVQSGKIHEPTVLSPLTSEMPNREGLKAEAPSAVGQGLKVDPAIAAAQAEIAKLQAELSMANAAQHAEAPETPSEPSAPPATVETPTEAPAAAPAATEPQHEGENAPSEPAK